MKMSFIISSIAQYLSLPIYAFFGYAFYVWSNPNITSEFRAQYYFRLAIVTLIGFLIVIVFNVVSNILFANQRKKASCILLFSSSLINTAFLFNSVYIAAYNYPIMYIIMVVPLVAIIFSIIGLAKRSN